MGVHFAAIFDHHLGEADFSSVPARLGVLEPLCVEITTYYRQWFDLPLPWEPWSERPIPPLKEFPRLSVGGGAGFDLSFGEKSVYVHHVERFYNFLAEEKPRHLLRRFCREFARMLEVNHSIYAPCEGGLLGVDPLDFVSDKLSVGEIERRLLNQGGEPVESLEVFCRQKLDLRKTELERYRKLFFIDNFSECSR
jgi:hypothetical protein